MSRLYLTYNNSENQDGVGAQLQRIFGIFSISRKFRVGYLHSPIVETLEELAHNLSSENAMQIMLDEVNSKYELPSAELIKEVKVVDVYNITLRVLMKYIFKAVFSKKDILLRVCLPYGIMDKHPDWYNYVGSEIRKRNRVDKKDSNKQFVVHVRHGYKPILGSNVASRPRFLPLTYYPEAIKNVLKQESLPLTTEIVIHTDIQDKSGIWKPFQKRKLSELSAIGYEIEDSKLRFESIDLKAEYFSEFPNLHVKYCAPILETLDDMIAADVLLMSRSSFSYVAGIVNPNSVYIPKSHGHGKMSRWKWDYGKHEASNVELLSGI